MTSKFEAATMQLEKETQQPEAAAPIGYKVIRESKSFRTSVILRPSTVAGLDEMAAERGIKRNALMADELEKVVIEYYKRKEI